MTRVARRKTLSHSEIENFLNDIDVTVDTQHSSCFVKEDNCQMQSTNDVKTVSPSITSGDPMRTEVEYIRAFTKATFATYKQGVPLEPTRDICDVGRNILAGSSYPVLSRRLLCPNDYLYPSSTLEAKKALLISLSPMLTSAEEERKKETVACENFTRCKSGKGKGKSACYDYTDIDVKCQVDFAEYEKRYLLYISQNKRTYAKVTPLPPSLNYITIQNQQHRRQERLHHNTKVNEKEIDITASIDTENQNPTLWNKSPENDSLKMEKSSHDITATGTIKPNKSPEGVNTRQPLRRIQPVQVDESTLDLVNALMKPKHRLTQSSATTSTTTITSTVSTTTANTVTSNNYILPSYTTTYKIEEETETITATKEVNVTALAAATSSCDDMHIPSATPPTTTTIFDDSVLTTTTDVPECIVSETTQMMACDEPISEFADIDAVTTGASSIGGGRNSNERKRKHCRGSGSNIIITKESPTQDMSCLNSSRYITRRGTLSPASVRAMLFEDCQAPQESEEEDCTAITSTTASLSESGLELQVTENIDQEYATMSSSSTDSSLTSLPNTHSTYFLSPEQHLYHLETITSITTNDNIDSLTTTTEVVQEHAELGSPLCSTEGSRKKHPRACSPATSALFAADILSSMAGSEECTISTTTNTEDDATAEVLEITENSEQEVLYQNTTRMCEKERHSRIENETLDAPLLVNMEEQEDEQNDDSAMNVSVALSTAEMEAIASFGRELDGILCDVHAAPSTNSTEEVQSVSSPSDKLIENDDELMCFSPTLTAVSARQSQPRRLSLEGLPSFSYSRRRSSMSFVASSRLEEDQQEKETISGVSEQVVVLHSHSPAAQGVCAISPIRAADSIRSPLPSEPIREICTAPPEAVSALLTNSSFSGHTEATPVNSTVCPTPSPHKPLSAISSMRSPLTGLREVTHSRSQTPTGSSPASSCSGGQHNTNTSHHSTTTPHSTATTTPDSNRHILSPVGISEEEVENLSSCSMDVSQLIYQAHDADLDDFEMLENMVQQEFQSGEFQWDFKLPPVPGTLSNTRIDVARLEDAVNSIDNLLHENHGDSGMNTNIITLEPQQVIQPKEGEGGSHISTSPTNPEDTATTTTTTTSHIPTPTSSSGSTTTSIENDTTSPPLQDIAIVEAQAKARFEERLKVARWQYEWEVVSAHMTNTAIRRLYKDKM